MFQKDVLIIRFPYLSTWMVWTTSSTCITMSWSQLAEIEDWMSSWRESRGAGDCIFKRMHRLEANKFAISEEPETPSTTDACEVNDWLSCLSLDRKPSFFFLTKDFANFSRKRYCCLRLTWRTEDLYFLLVLLLSWEDQKPHRKLLKLNQYHPVCQKLSICHQD